MWKLTAALQMELSKSERAKITDTVHSVQSAQASLAGVDAARIPELQAIRNCLKEADKNLRHALRGAPQKNSPA